MSRKDSRILFFLNLNKTVEYYYIMDISDLNSAGVMHYANIINLFRQKQVQ